MGPFEVIKTFSKKSLTMPKQIERRDPLGFSKIHWRKTSKKWRGDPFGRKNFFPKKVSQWRKTVEGEILQSRPVLNVVLKNELPFWSSSSGHMVLFDTVKYGRTFKNYSGQFM